MRHLSTASEGAEAMSQELFRARLDALINLSHPLAKLTQAMPWAEIEGAVSAMLPPAPVGAGRPALSIRLTAGAHLIEDAKEKIDSWRWDYNERRPHHSLEGLTPREFADQTKQLGVVNSQP